MNLVTILVTGGNGYIGFHAVLELIDQGYQVVVVDKTPYLPSRFKNLNAKYYQCDITNRIALKKVFEIEKDINSIFHFAGLISVGESKDKPLIYYDVNCGGTSNLLSLANEYNVDNFIFSSTAAVYGEADGTITEESSLTPINPYGNSKLAAENLVRDWGKAFNKHYLIFRYFNVSGFAPNWIPTEKSDHFLSDGHLIANLNLSLLKYYPQFSVFGNNYPTPDGTCIRDYIHVTDVVVAHILGLKWLLKTKNSTVFNLGTGRGYSVGEVLKQAQTILKTTILTKIESSRPGDPIILVADGSKAKKLLNWEPQKDLSSMILSDYNFRK